jgi:predicted transcriptional regulator
MATLTVRISDTSRNTLRKLAAKEGASMQAILDKAVESYRRQLFLEEVNKAYAALRQDQGAWAQIEQEREAWDTTLEDGLESAQASTQKAQRYRRGGRKQRG